MAPAAVEAVELERTAVKPVRRSRAVDLTALGEPYLWTLGGALAFGCLMIVGFLALVLWNGMVTFWPKPIAVVTMDDGTRIAGEPVRDELYRPGPDQLAKLTPAQRQEIQAANGFGERTLYRIGNYDLYGDDFRWVSTYQRSAIATPADLMLFERLEWGVFIGTVKAVAIDGQRRDRAQVTDAVFHEAHAVARERLKKLHAIERGQIGAINHTLDAERLKLRRVELSDGKDSAAYAAAQQALEARQAELGRRYDALAADAKALKDRDLRDTVTLADIDGKEKEIPLSALVRFYAANDLGILDKLAIYGARWWEFVSDEPREANTEGGVMPAIFGTFALTLLLVVVVAPFGVITALYLREYAKQGRMVAVVRISVNNLAGVPSIVYGVFGLGFFAYLVGGTIDSVFFPERLPSPTFGTGGLLWSSLTLALLTVPVVIVATEEALAAVPRSMREGSLACGASKWQTIQRIVLPRAMPGILTGIILAMARGAGEVAPLMLVGVVKLAPELPIDGYFPFVHLERSFMHLGFHIYDVGFQSRNSEAGKPMVFVTTLLLIGLVFVMNIGAIMIRNRLKRRFAGSQF
ncbi:MAG: phosphate ABC transporter permease PstA [Rhodospirillales bacterium]|nr:phosphate ABC transporter permease PstA [Rhodospirillales bacterium]